MLKKFLVILFSFYAVIAGGCKRKKGEEMMKNNSIDENDFVEENPLELLSDRVENYLAIPRNYPFKNVKKQILLIILEFSGGHYNLMLCDKWFYDVMKNMNEQDYANLIKLYALEAFIYSRNAYSNRNYRITCNVHAEHSLSKNGKVLVTKRKEELPWNVQNIGFHFGDNLIEAYDENFFPVLLKYKNIHFALEDHDVTKYIFFPLNPRVQAYIRLDIKITKDEIFFLEHNALPDSWYDHCQRAGTRKTFIYDEVRYTYFLRLETSRAMIHSDLDYNRCTTVDMKDVTFETMSFKDAMKKFRNCEKIL